MQDEFSLVRNLTLGQYLPTGSVIHRLDPRTKLLGFILLVGAVTFESSYLGNAVLLLAIMVLVMASRVPLSYALRGLRPALPFLIFLAVMQLIFYTEGFAGGGAECRTLVRWWFFRPTDCTVQLVVVSAARFVELLMLTTLLTFTTSTTELAYGTEMLLSPFRRFGMPAHELALIVTIALRFVPTFAEELERIMKAQVSRGADLGQGGGFRFIQRSRATLPLMVPLFLGALQRAEELVLAMESRGYVGGQGRTHLLEFERSSRDWVALAVAGLFAVAMILMPWPF